MRETIFVWDSVNDCVMSELDGSGAVQVTYTNEPQQYGGVISQRRGTTTSTYHADALGSTRFLTDSSGNVTDTYLNDAWGNSVASTGTTVNAFKWVGKYGYYTDNSTGQVYVRARMYQPTVARWCSPDPHAARELDALFNYSDNCPARNRDPSGLFCCNPDIPTGGAVATPEKFCSTSKTCIITMKNWPDIGHHPNPTPDEERWNKQAGLLAAQCPKGNAVVARNMTMPPFSKLIDFITANKCCQLVLIGHADGTGGISVGTTPGFPTASDPTPGDGRILLLPRPGLENEIGMAFSANGCNQKCRIYVYSCQNPRSRDWQILMARRTGCEVCGTLCGVSVGGESPPPEYTPGDFDPSTPLACPPTNCVSASAKTSQESEAQRLKEKCECRRPLL